jgi:hypothetical protein
LSISLLVFFVSAGIEFLRQKLFILPKIARINKMC